MSEIARGDLMAANHEAARRTGIPYLTEAGHYKAMAIFK
jgi:hypothetical protein